MAGTAAPSRYDLTPGEHTVYTRPEQKAARSLLFAGTVLGLIGVMNVIAAVSALDGSEVYRAHDRLALFSLHTWGWIMLVAGLLELAASFAIFTGSRLARGFGIVVCSVNAIAQLGFVPAHPVWALTALAANLFALRALVRYAGGNVFGR